MKARSSAKWESAVAAVAQGETLLSWSQRSNVPYSTARSWSSDPAFKRDVLAIQAAVLDTAVAKLNAASGELADNLVGIAKGGRSESTRVLAIRACWEDMIKLESHAKLRAEVHELREMVARLMETQASAGIDSFTPRSGEPESGG